MHAQCKTDGLLCKPQFDGWCGFMLIVRQECPAYPFPCWESHPGLPNSSTVPPPQQRNTWKGLNLGLNVMQLCKSQGCNTVQKQTENMARFQPSEQCWAFFICFCSCTCECTHIIPRRHLQALPAQTGSFTSCCEELINQQSCYYFQGVQSWAHSLLSPLGYTGAQAAEHSSNAFMGPAGKDSSGRGTGEAAVNMLTLSKGFTTSCQIRRFFFPFPTSSLTWVKLWQEGSPPLQIQWQNFLTVVGS